MQPLVNIPGQRLFAGYYAATAAFLVADYALSFNIRLAFLDDLPAWRFAYYLFCFLCLLLVRRYPAWANVIAASESLVNVSGLILHMGIRVITLSGAAIDSGRPPVSVQEVFNFLISGSAAYMAVWLHSRRVHSQMRAERRKGIFK